MKDQAHERARKLLEASRVEGITPDDQAWLNSHLESCAGCESYAESLEHTLATLRLFQMPINPAIVDKTRRRLHLRARELHEHEARMRALWLACAVSWVVGVGSAPLVWWGLEWIGQHIALPRPVWFLAFALWWIAPAVVVAAVLTWRRSRAATENGYVIETLL